MIKSKKIESQNSIKNNSSLSTSSLLKEENIFMENSYSKRKIFEVSHKYEKIFVENSNKISKNCNSSNILYKCIYCGNEYCNIIRFESHMKMHVSSYKYNINFFRLERSHTNALFATKLLKRKEI